MTAARSALYLHRAGPLLAGLVVALAAAGPYLSTLDAYFLGDDFGLVQLFAGKPPLHVLTLFTSSWTETIYGDVADELRPLIALSYQVDSAWGAASPFGYHVTSVVLHALNALLVLALARWAVRLSLGAATFAGTLFALLPVHPETVAWISGRADSIPALFYLAACLAYARWRRTGSAGWYGAAVLACCLALFAKQSAITLVVSLAAYDLLALGVPLRELPRLVRAWLPFAALTAGYLALRYALFGNAVREQLVTRDTFAGLGALEGVHLHLLIFGREVVPTDPNAALAGWLLIALTVALAGSVLVRAWLGRGSTALGRAVAFGPVWWLIATAPLAVTYLSPRHLYLASVGVAIGLACVGEALWQPRRTPLVAASVTASGPRASPGAPFGPLPLWRGALVVLAGGLLVLCGVRLQVVVAEWNTAAAVSERMVRETEREAAALPPGSLLLLGAPYSGSGGVPFIYLWSFGLPFALQPPFAPSDPAERVTVAALAETDCCGPARWYEATRRGIATWADRPTPAPVVALLWQPWTGELMRQTEADAPELREAAAAVAQSETPRAACERLLAIFQTLDPAWDYGCIPGW